MSGEVPDGWRHAKLGEAAALSGGTTPSKIKDAYWADGTVPWATPSDITSLPLGQTRIVATEGHVAELALKDCSLKLNPPNTVLMTSRATIGYAVINDVPMATNQGFLNFTCSDDCDPDYLCQWLNSNRGLLTAAAGGSTFKELSKGTAKLLPLLLPPLYEQRRIAEVLRSMDEAIAYNETAGWAARKLVRQLASDIGARATDSAPIGSLWGVVTGRTPAPDNRELWDGDLPFVTPGDVNDQDVSVRSSARSLKSSAPHGGRVVPAGSLLVTCIGSTVGKMGVSHVEVSTNQQINAVCCPPESSGYAYVACLSILEEILGNAGRQAVPIINKTTFSSLEIPLLSPVEMKEINETVLALDEEIVTARHAIHQLRQLKTCVCSDLLSGRVRVPA